VISNNCDCPASIDCCPSRRADEPLDLFVLVASNVWMPGYEVLPPTRTIAPIAIGDQMGRSAPESG
jgi:hypothetical protein